SPTPSRARTRSGGHGGGSERLDKPRVRRHFQRFESLTVTEYDRCRHVRIPVPDDAIAAWCLELVLLRYELSEALVLDGPGAAICLELTTGSVPREAPRGLALWH